MKTTVNSTVANESQEYGHGNQQSSNSYMAHSLLPEYTMENGLTYISYYHPDMYYKLHKVHRMASEKLLISLLKSKLLIKSDIGKIVFLENSETDCKEWIITDADESGVTLLPRYSLGHHCEFGPNNLYFDSCILDWLKHDFLNGFSEDVRRAMKTQLYTANESSRLETYVKCPSLDELQSILQISSIKEGISYPILRDCENPQSTMFWTRSCHAITGTGEVACINHDNTADVVGFIKF